MKIGCVRATVTATIKHPVYEARSLMVVELCNPDFTPTGAEILAVDTVQAGIGDYVLVLKEGNSAAAILGTKNPPLQELIVGIIDSVSMHAGVTVPSQNDSDT
ncbi:EutN/CcmL family microcompartment protein [Alkalispirochaeta alkalica]|uniref:EutN/CcmL family microcompartment protein n=1 Tax=Alkalispirochaeta alkalica TaxID=46356 RepID=UPI0003663A77|nr:EutN/CcmL family microcompartment protein [Alkalispirochaeta alkalica]